MSAPKSPNPTARERLRIESGYALLVDEHAEELDLRDGAAVALARARSLAIALQTDADDLPTDIRNTTLTAIDCFIEQAQVMHRVLESRLCKRASSS